MIRRLLPLLLVASLSSFARTGPAPPRGGAPTETGTASLGVQGALSLESEVRARIARAPGTVGVMLVDLQSGDSLAVNADVSMHAASTMKVPVLLELFRRVAEGRLSLADSIPVRNAFTSIADGTTYHLSPDDDSETALYGLVGRRTSLRDLAERMITASSNLATNNLIDLVGADSVRALMERMGTSDMVVLRGVEDIPAFDRGMNNRTTARALAGIFARIGRCERGESVPGMAPLGPAECREITDILARQEFNSKIPAGLPPGIRVAHKTGWITGIDHDAGLVYPPGRAPYALAVLTEEIPDTAVAHGVARDVSRIIWEKIVER